MFYVKKNIKDLNQGFKCWENYQNSPLPCGLGIFSPFLKNSRFSPGCPEQLSYSQSQPKDDKCSQVAQNTKKVAQNTKKLPRRGTL
jgi:hypothetical protein